MLDMSMFIAIGCVAVVAIIYRLRRDVWGPKPTFWAKASSWGSLGLLAIWLAGWWVAGESGSWFDTALGAGTLAGMQVACLLVMVADTVYAATRPPAGRHGA
jgi:hypothetical protein